MSRRSLARNPTMLPEGGQPSNPRLQRTRSAPLRSPLSRKPLAATGELEQC